MQFSEWMEARNIGEYEDAFANNGILTFESFYHYIYDSKDLIAIIGENNKCDAELIWNATPKMARILNR